MPLTLPRQLRLSGGAAGIIAAAALCAPGGAHATAGTTVPATTGATVPANTWGCSSSAVNVTLLANAPIQPLIANPDGTSCSTDTVGLNDLGPSVSNLIGGDALNAITETDSAVAPDVQSPTSYATVTNLSLTNSALPLLQLPGTISSQVSATCVDGAAKYAGSGTTAPLVIGGHTIPTDKAVTETLSGLGKLTGAVLSIVPGQVTQTATSYTRDGLHVTLKLGATDILDLVVSQATASVNGDPCLNSAPDGGNNFPGGITDTGVDSTTANVTYLLNELKAGFDQFGARIASERLFDRGTQTRTRIECWRRHKGSCSVEIWAFRLPTHVLVGSAHVRVRPGHFKIIALKTRKLARYPVFLHLSSWQ
jgi:hypothetical protein